MGKKRNTPAEAPPRDPTPAELDELEELNHARANAIANAAAPATLDDYITGRDVAPAYAGVDDELVSGKPDELELDDVSDPAPSDDELEADVELEEEEPGNVRHIRRAAPESVPPARAYRWIVPQVNGPAYAHALLVGASFVMCAGAHAEGGIYPPAPDVPKCAACVAAIEKERARDAG